MLLVTALDIFVREEILTHLLPTQSRRVCLRFFGGFDSAQPPKNLSVINREQGH